MSNGEDKPPMRFQDACHCTTGSLQVRDIHQRHVAHHTIKAGVRDAAARLRIALSVGYRWLRARLIALCKGKESSGDVDTDEDGSLLSELACNNTLTTGEVTDVLSLDETNQFKDSGKYECM
jgi:hypothetical protein